MRVELSRVAAAEMRRVGLLGRESFQPVTFSCGEANSGDGEDCSTFRRTYLCLHLWVWLRRELSSMASGTCEDDDHATFWSRI